MNNLTSTLPNHEHLEKMKFTTKLRSTFDTNSFSAMREMSNCESPF